jgi:hypothetical protein
MPVGTCFVFAGSRKLFERPTYTCDNRSIYDLDTHCNSLLPSCVAGNKPCEHTDGGPVEGYCHCQSCGETGVALCDHGYCAACHEEE